jgi:hypothetical protein
MAKVKRRKEPVSELPTLAQSIESREMMTEFLKEDQRIPKAMSSEGTLGKIPSAMTGPIGGDIGTIKSTAQPMERPAAKAKVKRKANVSVSAPAPAKAPEPKEPLSPQNWVNQGNQPSAYKDYLAAWEKQSASKKVKVKKKG